MAILAPQVTSLRISKLSSTQVMIEWDDVGSNFYYFVDIASTRDVNGDAIPSNQIQWTNLGYTPDPLWFDNSFMDKSSYYMMRVRTTGKGFSASNNVYTEEFQTFDQNAYNIEKSKNLTLTKNFIDKKLINPTTGQDEIINFNTAALQATLMTDNFQFSSEFKDLSQISNFVLSEEQYHEVQNSISAVCVSENRDMLAEMEGILYLFERYQYMVKVSNDKGQNWKYVKLLNDIVGNPVSRTCLYQSSNTSYVLGYTKIFYGRSSNDIRFSSDEYKFSNDEATFTKLGDQLDLGFNTEVFGLYSSLPGEVAKHAEAFCCNNDYLYVVARDKVRYIKLKQAPVDTDKTSPTFGEKLFETPVLNITGNKRAVCTKMDSVGDRVFALITGEVKADNLDPTIPSNVIDSASKGIYVLNDDGKTFKRVFGNTDEERRRIEHVYTNMSTDGVELFFSSSNYKYSTIDNETQFLPDGATSGVRYSTPSEYHHDKHYNMMSFRSNEDTKWETFYPGRMNYYAEPFFTWLRKSGNRTWITNNDHAAVVYASNTYTITVDTNSQASSLRTLREKWELGDLTVTIPDIHFTGFNKLANGIMFHQPNGALIGYWEFSYHVRDSADIIWKPKNIFFTASMVNQTREVPWTPENVSKYKDPDLRPILNTMVPDSYLLEDTNFEAFCSSYLRYISDGYGTHYNNLLNLIKNKYPREEHAWEYLWSEMYKRNIYLSKDIRDSVVKFFESRSTDFYSTKGTEASYKFLFKLLYNEDVEIDIESKNTTEYGIVVTSDNISNDIVGRTIQTATGQASVTYIERDYKDGKLVWNMTIHNLSGNFMVGQKLTSNTSSFAASIITGIKGKQMAENNINYIDRSKSYYVMKIKSALPTSRYKDDVLRFVHPVGFGFVGITLLTMFINSGMTMKIVETAIEILKNYRFDAGLPSVYPDRVAVLDANGKIERDPITGEAIYNNSPNKDKPFPLRSDYMSENNNSVIYGQNPDQRRKENSPLMDQSSVTFSKYRDLVNKRLKDDIGNPRDPSPPTQVKLGKDNGY